MNAIKITVLLSLICVAQTLALAEQPEIQHLEENPIELSSSNHVSVTKVTVSGSAGDIYQCVLIWAKRPYLLWSGFPGDYSVTFSENSKCLIVFNYGKVWNAVRVFLLDIKKQNVYVLFDSAKNNAFKFVDYQIGKWDFDEGRLILEGLETLRYNEQGNEPRILCREYIYFDLDESRLERVVPMKKGGVRAEMPEEPALKERDHGSKRNVRKRSIDTN